MPSCKVVLKHNVALSLKVKLSRKVVLSLNVMLCRNAALSLRALGVTAPSHNLGTSACNPSCALRCKRALWRTLDNTNNNPPPQKNKEIP